MPTLPFEVLSALKQWVGQIVHVYVSESSSFVKYEYHGLLRQLSPEYAADFVIENNAGVSIQIAPPMLPADAVLSSGPNPLVRFTYYEGNNPTLGIKTLVTISRSSVIGFMMHPSEGWK